MGLGESYDTRRQGIIDRRGCLDGMGNPVLAASISSVPRYNISDGRMYSLFALAVSTDLAVPEPSDGAILKWGGYAIGGHGKLRSMNLRMYKDFSGTQKQIKIEEKHKLYNYFLTYGHLPPGNAVFR
ncbi:MAG: hypothetical protein MJY88_07660 [Bacteroidales bacterium]|nr:hypothetical protein [Bacteroidales bacterium]